MLVLANLGDLGPTRRNHNVKAPGNRIDGPGNQRLAIDIGKHLVRAKPLALARSHNDATEFHLRKPPLAVLDTIVAIPTIPSSHSVGTGTRSFSSERPLALHSAKEGTPRRRAPSSMVQICLLSVAGKRGTGLAGKTVTRLLEQRDERREARLALGKRRGGLNLGQHGAATELVGLG